MPRTTKSSPNGTAQKTNLLEMVKDIATLKAEKVGWWRGGIAIGVVTATMLSTILGVAFYLDGKIEAVRTEQQEIRTEFMTEIASVKGELIEIKVLLKMGLAQQGIIVDDATIRAIIDEFNANPPLAPSNLDTNPDTPINPTPKPKENHNVPL